MRGCQTQRENRFRQPKYENDLSAKPEKNTGNGKTNTSAFPAFSFLRAPSVSLKNSKIVKGFMARWPTHPYKIHKQHALVAKQHFFRPLPHHAYRPNPQAVGR